MLLVLGVTKRFRQFIGEFVNLFKRPKLLMSLTIASVLISGNWFVYIWAVNHNHVIEASLGYYINPLISILLGTVVLKEKLNFWQYVAVGFSWSGSYHFNSTFRGYPVGFFITCPFIWIIRINEKLLNYDATIGLTMETMLVTPFAIIYLVMTGVHGFGSFGSISMLSTLLLIGAGIVTALPLFYFAKGAQLIPLYMVGFTIYCANN